MIYIDPSELRSSSKLKKYLLGVDYKSLPGLEARTGADVMISPDGLLVPKSDALLNHHIESGAKLFQVKFGHDLSASIVDDRFNEALSRMLESGANSWQCLLLFIGTLTRQKDIAIINGQQTYNRAPMKWKQVQAALTFWSERGGTLDFPLCSGKLIKEHFKIHQSHLDRFRSGETTKVIWPTMPAFYDEIDKSQPLLKQWKAAQELKPVDDFRVLLCAIPGAKIGPDRATAIYEWMSLNGKKMSFYGFLEVLDGKELLEVPGIGKGILENIRKGLNDE